MSMDTMFILISGILLGWVLCDIAKSPIQVYVRAYQHKQQLENRFKRRK